MGLANWTRASHTIAMSAPRLVACACLCLLLTLPPAWAQIEEVQLGASSGAPVWDAGALARGLDTQLQILQPWLGAPYAPAAQIAGALAANAQTIEQQQAAGVLMAALAEPETNIPRLEALLAAAPSPGDAALGRRVVKSLEPWKNIFARDDAARQAIKAAAASAPGIDRWKALFDGGGASAIENTGPVAAPASPVGAQKLSASALKPAPWHRRIDFAGVEKNLARGEIKTIVAKDVFFSSEGRETPGTQEAFVVTFADGSRAIWKPEKKLRNSYAEKAAYDLSKLIGLPLVPPTVIRKIGEREGSLQFWIESAVDPAKMSSKDFYARIPREEFSAIEIFQFIFGQWDRHKGNLIVDAAPSAAMIDNSAIGTRQKVRYGELPYLLLLPMRKEAAAAHSQDEAFPFDSAVPVPAATAEAFRAALSGKVEDKAIDDGKWIWNKKTAPNLKVVFWRGNVWIQRDLPSAPIMVPEFREKELARYRTLTFENLRATLPQSFSDDKVRDILERRDQILAAAVQPQPAPRP